MKNFVSAALVAITLSTAFVSQSAHAMQIVAIVVGGSVTTVALSVPFAIMNGRGKGEIFQEALDVVAAGDLSLMSPGIEQMLEDAKKANPELAQIDELELLDAILNGSFIE